MYVGLNSCIKTNMMQRLISFLFVCLLFAVTLAKNETQNAIGFPEVEEDLNSKNKEVSF